MFGFALFLMPLEVQRKILKADQVEGQIRLDIEPQSKPVEAGLLEVNLTFVSGRERPTGCICGKELESLASCECESGAGLLRVTRRM